MTLPDARLNVLRIVSQWGWVVRIDLQVLALPEDLQLARNTCEVSHTIEEMKESRGNLRSLLFMRHSCG